ncbi:Ig-like domain-containing protein [Paenibacillus sp. LjRoot153]|uniref:Ig-like domain-containing protein n=1 Tax=Paenibacillus sp. LjRoot153 TaxID=3342270 RepID=UPI003ECEB3BD
MKKKALNRVISIFQSILLVVSMMSVALVWSTPANAATRTELTQASSATEVDGDNKVVRFGQTTAMVAAVPAPTVEIVNDPGNLLAFVQFSNFVGSFIGQSFIAPKSGVIESISVSTAILSDVAILEIRAGEGEDGELLHSQPVPVFNTGYNGDSPPNDYRFPFVELPITEEVNVINGNQYTFVFRNHNDSMAIVVSTQSTYADGKVFWEYVHSYPDFVGNEEYCNESNVCEEVDMYFKVEIRDVATPSPAVNSVSVTPETASIVQGETQQLTATVDAIGVSATTVTWTSSDSDNKVTVDNDGLVSVAADAATGTYTITATSTYDGTKTDTATITVTAAPAVNSVSVTPETASIVQGETQQLTATVDAVGGSATTVTWTSSDSDNKVTVDNDGLVSVAADAATGTYTITATSTYDGTKTDTATITVTAPAPAVNSVSVTPETASIVQGETQQLTATVDAVGGSATTVTWTSSDSDNKVTVDNDGLVSVAADAATGTYTITATSTYDGTKTDTATITVTAAPAVNSVSVTPETASIVQGETQQLTATVDAVGGSATTVTWTSSDSDNKVTVDNDGLVSVAADAATGTYTITATSTYDGTKTDTATITVTAAPAINSVSVTPETASIVQGETQQLTATVDAVGGSATTVTWTSSDSDNKVTVDNDGLVSVAADAATGTYTITATSTYDGTKTDTATITVTAAPAVNSVSVTPETASIVQGETQQLTATVDAVGGSATTVTWTSSDSDNKVTVDNDGLVSVAADAATGTYTITATSTYDGTKTDTATITVTAAPTYSIAAIVNQTATDLIKGYTSSEPKIITITNIGTGNLFNLTAALSGTNANDFVITLPDSTLNSGETTTFSVKAKDGLSEGTYTTTVTVSATNMTNVTFSMTQVVNLLNAPVNPQNLVATGGDRQVTMNWSSVPGATYYNVYVSTTSGQFSNEPVADTVTDITYNIKNLTNGTTYYFIVKAGNLSGLSGQSNQVDATPVIVPAVPTNVTAVAGNGQATISFTPPVDNGGSAIIRYEVAASLGDITVTGTASPITITGLSNGTSYTFTVKAINRVGSSELSAASNAVIPRSPSSGNDENSSSPTQPTTPSTSETMSTRVDVLVNGKVENAGTATTTKVNEQTVTTIAIDQKKLEDKLTAEGQGAVVTIPINAKSDVVVGELNGQMVKSMESKDAVIEIKTDSAMYTLPAKQINIDAVSDQIGKTVAIQDITIHIEIAKPTTDTVKVVDSAASKGEFTIVAPPLNFTVTGTYGDKTIDVSKFNTYVERTIAIPDGVDPSKITTGVVIDPDGSVRHVPTKVVLIDGKYYAKINNLTNSTYTVVWHPIEFSDVANHWAKDAVNDMGSRMVISGFENGLFKPEQNITRAEFAAIIVRGLGLKLDKETTPFRDVNQNAWYHDAIQTAYSNGLVNGFEDGSFRPDDKITREQAMVMLFNAMRITRLQGASSKQTNNLFQTFADAGAVSDWAKSGVADSVFTGIVSGRGKGLLSPKALITRAEVAKMMQLLLQKSNLI